MLSLPAELNNLCSMVLVQCDELNSTNSLRAVFVTSELAPFANDLPERAGGKKGFVDDVKLFLLEKRLADGRALLLPFLDTLRGRYPREDALRGELDDLYGRVLALTQPTPPGARSGDAAPASPSAPEKGAEVAPTRLLTFLDNFFNQSDLEELCFGLGVDFDNLDGDNKRGKARSLIEYCQHRGRYAELVRLAQQARPGMTL